MRIGQACRLTINMRLVFGKSNDRHILQRYFSHVLRAYYLKLFLYQFDNQILGIVMFHCPNDWNGEGTNTKLDTFNEYLLEKFSEALKYKEKSICMILSSGHLEKKLFCIIMEEKIFNCNFQEKNVLKWNCFATSKVIFNKTI